MQLAHPVVEVLPQPVAMADQLAQVLGRLVVQPGGRGALLEAERARPRASIASVLVRSRLASWKRRVRSGLSSATSCPAAASTANRFFQ